MEKSLFIAIKIVFPESRHTTCNFHVLQAICKHLNLKTSEGLTILLHIKKFMNENAGEKSDTALKNLNQLSKKLQEMFATESCKKFWEYFYTNLVFDTLWTFDRIFHLDGPSNTGDRSNNPVEAMNHRFKEAWRKAPNSNKDTKTLLTVHSILTNDREVLKDPKKHHAINFQIPWKERQRKLTMIRKAKLRKELQEKNIKISNDEVVGIENILVEEEELVGELTGETNFEEDKDIQAEKTTNATPSAPKKTTKKASALTASKKPSEDPIDEEDQLLQVLLQDPLGYSETVAKNMMALLNKSTHKKDFVAKIENIPHNMFSTSAINAILIGRYKPADFEKKLGSKLPDINVSSPNYWNDQLKKYKKTQKKSK